jgi:putative lipoprotein (rSAM/lipoprotein system)
MKINTAMIRVMNWALAGILALLGFTNCESKEECEYGVPNADYKIKGTVTDKANAKPIKGIMVTFNPNTKPVLMYGVMPTPYREYKSDITDQNGQYEFTEHFSIGEIPDNQGIVYVVDTDGAENGLYNDTTLNVDLNKAKQTRKGDDWYEGEFSIDLNIKLTKNNEGNK